MKFQLKAGDPPPNVMDVSDHFFGEGEEGGALLVGNIPDFVTLPPELGGGRADITDRGWFNIRCPQCSAAGPIYTMVTDREHPVDEAKVVAVMCCQSCEQYVWIGWEAANGGSDEHGPESPK